jgi:tungstate transport system substrate-binding protein
MGEITMKKKIIPVILIALVTVLVTALAGCAGNQKTEEQPKQAGEPQKKEIILATTTSTQDSGLLDVLLPVFQEKTGYVVKTVAVGTGMALKMGEEGNADVLLVHAPDAEKPLVDSGVAVNYQLVMHNDFVLLGPPGDPAQVKGTTDIAEAFKKIAGKGALFISRGDDSGTDKKEKDIWKKAGIDPKGQKWYQETGQGMGASITVAAEKQAYILSDRGTYLAHSKNVDLQIVSEGDDLLKNIYHVMQVNPEKFPKVNSEGGKAFVEFMIDKETQQVIKKFGVDKFGQSLFFPDRLEG